MDPLFLRFPFPLPTNFVVRNHRRPTRRYLDQLEFANAPFAEIGSDGNRIRNYERT